MTLSNAKNASETAATRLFVVVHLGTGDVSTDMEIAVPDVPLGEAAVQQLIKWSRSGRGRPFALQLKAQL